jgi:hypothetical protein
MTIKNKFLKVLWVLLSEIITAIWWVLGFLGNLFPIFSFLKEPAYWIIGSIFTVFVVFQSISSKIKLFDRTPNIIVERTFTDIQDNHQSQYARVVFKNSPLNNNDDAKSEDVYANLWYLNKDFNSVLKNSLIGRWATSSNIPSSKMGPKEIRDIQKVVFEASGLSHQLDICYKNPRTDEVYGYDNQALINWGDFILDHKLSGNEWTVVIKLNGTKFSKFYFFKLLRNLGGEVSIQENKLLLKTKKQIISKLP